MGNWIVIQTLTSAHKVGLTVLDSLAQAVVDLKEGQRHQALDAFEKAVKFFDGDLKLHFDHEERALFPVMRRVIGPGGPVEAMVKEHDSLWNCIDEFVEELEGLTRDIDTVDSKRIAEVCRLANHVVFMLSGHIEREDTMLFPLAENILDEECRREVSLNMAMVEDLARKAP